MVNVTLLSVTEAALARPQGGRPRPPSKLTKGERRMLNELQGKRVAIYARSSNMVQRDASMDAQVRSCTNYIFKNGGDVRPELVFGDSGVSGTTIVPADLERLMNEVRGGNVDVIVTLDRSRLTRDSAYGATLRKEFEERGVGLVDVTEGLGNIGEGD